MQTGPPTFFLFQWRGFKRVGLFSQPYLQNLRCI